ncbi:hypothetical protein [Chelatococcus reniformis]|uniref:Uncharacterized protein n=1 Tax=Chelatococcus reniformis TaxID=1494448 RepID=A0A916U9K7_9HYPH|nr:hypothetical protein [Chelatococcus reniformis]GGC64783.1 hypothetical protein GCM10010994_24190 [Chelatococcus reniformis]
MERSFVVPMGLGLRLLFVVLALVGAVDGFVCLQFPQQLPQLTAVEGGPGGDRSFMLLAAALADDDDHQHLALGPSGKAIAPAAASRVERAAASAAGETSAVEAIHVAYRIQTLGPRGPPRHL